MPKPGPIIFGIGGSWLLKNVLPERAQIKK
jgi:hypothetical protein